MKKAFLIISIVLAVSCKEQNEDIDTLRAKWFFYAYSTGFDCYDEYGNLQKPLSCDVGVRSIRQSAVDTIQYFFDFYTPNGLKKCTVKPYQMVGVSMIRHTIYIPIYDMIVEEEQDSSVLLKRMIAKDQFLQNYVKSNPGVVNPWLKEAFKSLN